MYSSACTISTRSMDKSGSGKSVSSASIVRLRSLSGQCMTPWPAGMAASTRSASPRNMERYGVAKPSPSTLRPLVSGHNRRSLLRTMRCAVRPSRRA